MSTLSADNTSDLEIPYVEIPNVEIPNAEIPNIHQESATASSSASVKKQTSPYYKYFTLGSDKRWHCNYCR
jgi:hypothetical protein